MGVLDIFNWFPGDVFDGCPGDIWWVSWRYLIGVLVLFDRCPGDI